MASLAPPYFSTLSHNDYRGKKFIENKICVLFSLQFLFQTILFFFLKKISARYFLKCENVFMENTRFSYRILIKLAIFSPPQILDKSLNTKFHKNPFNGSRVVPHGRTDRHDEANFRFLQFFEEAQKLKYRKKALCKCLFLR